MTVFTITVRSILLLFVENICDVHVFHLESKVYMQESDQPIHFYICSLNIPWISLSALTESSSPADRQRYFGYDPAGPKTHDVPKKLEGVGPVDNRPSTNYLNHFVQEKKKKKK